MEPPDSKERSMARKKKEMPEERGGVSFLPAGEPVPTWKHEEPPPLLGPVPKELLRMPPTAFFSVELRYISLEPLCDLLLSEVAEQRAEGMKRVEKERPEIKALAEDFYKNGQRESVRLAQTRGRHRVVEGKERCVAMAYLWAWKGGEGLSMVFATFPDMSRIPKGCYAYWWD
jgi:hypothetical protein